MGTGKSVVVGVSIAGPSEAALIDCQGHVLRRCPIKMLRGRAIAATLDPYLRAIEEMLALVAARRWRVQGISVSLPGSLDEDASRPVSVPMLPALNNFPLCQLLETRYTLPIRLLVDVDAALLGESRFGAARGHIARRLLYLSVNAVVGAALSVDGVLARPIQSCLGHVSHLPISSSGPRCSCGKRGCINSLISLDAIQKMAQRALQRGEVTTLARRLLDRDAASIPQIIAEEARNGDAVAARIYAEVQRWLNAAITQYITLLEPNAIILGGETIRACDLLWEHDQPGNGRDELGNGRDELGNGRDKSGNGRDKSAPTGVATRAKIIPACLGRDAALLGVAAAFMTPNMPLLT
jgi:glucokinase